MKNIILFVLCLANSFAFAHVNHTAPVVELKHYKSDFTDTDGDGMTDVAELRYGFDPNDKNSFPSKDYTTLTGQTHNFPKSKGPTDPTNELRLEFNPSDYSGDSTKFASDRSLINLVMPIMLKELGPPPHPITIKVIRQNRGTWSNVRNISIQNNQDPQGIIHELLHSWKGNDYFFMNGKNRQYMRGFEEGFAEGGLFVILNKFVEAYPNHSLSKEMYSAKNADTWRGHTYRSDQTKHQPWLRGGTYYTGAQAMWRYTAAAFIFKTIANQREGALRDIMTAFYEHKFANPNWDYSENTQEMFEVWSKVLPTINGIDTVEWLSNVGILDGKPAPQRLYPILEYDRVYLAYPDSVGNLNWSHTSSAFASQNIPSWFPTANVGGKIKPSVANQPFNMVVKTLHGENAMLFSGSTTGSTDGLHHNKSFRYTNFPIGLYIANLEFPNFAKHTSNNKSQIYILGSKHLTQSTDELLVRIGVDIPTAESVQLEVENKNFETQLVNGVAVFRLKQFGVDFTGMSTIRVSDGNTENVYKRSISHTGNLYGYRVNDLLIIDKDFDNIEDLYDDSVIPLVSSNPTLYSDILANASSLANLETKEVEAKSEPTPTPPTTGNPTKPAPPTWNPGGPPQTDEQKKIAELEKRIKELETANEVLEDTNSNLTNSKVQLENQNKVLNNTKVVLEQTIATKTDTNANLVKVNDAFKVQVEDMNSTLSELNATLIVTVAQVANLNNTNKQLQLVNDDLIAQKSNLENSNVSLGAEKTELLRRLSEFMKQLQEVTSEKNDLIADNQKLSESVKVVQNQLNSSTTENASLVQTVSSLTEQTELLNETLEEAIKVAQTTFINGWIYDPNQGWLFTNSEMYPMIFSNQTQSWHFYELGSNPRTLFNYESNEWEEWE